MYKLTSDLAESKRLANYIVQSRVKGGKGGYRGPAVYDCISMLRKRSDKDGSKELDPCTLAKSDRSWKSACAKRKKKAAMLKRMKQKMQKMQRNKKMQMQKGAQIYGGQTDRLF